MVQESFLLLRKVPTIMLSPHLVRVQVLPELPGTEQLLNEEVFARLLGEFDLVNVSIEFGHPFQAVSDGSSVPGQVALEHAELYPLKLALQKRLLKRITQAGLGFKKSRLGQFVSRSVCTMTSLTS